MWAPMIDERDWGDAKVFFPPAILAIFHEVKSEMRDGGRERDLRGCRLDTSRSRVLAGVEDSSQGAKGVGWFSVECSGAASYGRRYGYFFWISCSLSLATGSLFSM